eukprot:5332332-Prymnesium_polylepis.1
MYPHLNSVLEGSASTTDKALLEMSAQLQAQSRAQSEQLREASCAQSKQLREAVSSLRAEHEAALDAVWAGAGEAAAL